MRLDAHQHFWRYSADTYAWIPRDAQALCCDRQPADLWPLLQECGLDGCVAVQAQQTEGETTCLLAHAAAQPWIRGVVGWLDMSSDACADQIAGRQGSALCGLRHVVQDEADGFLDAGQIDPGLQACANADLAYDLLIYPRQLPEALRLLDRHPNLRIVLDHAGKPAIADGGFDAWAPGVQALAQRPQLCCKISGLVTEADHARWDYATLRPYLDHLLTCFGPERLAFGSDWPVCGLAAAYQAWFRVVDTWSAAFSASERAALFGGTAVQWYQLKE
ncbi:MAG: amidohydrolase family protein [Planctomycetota bacterium]|jgi:L-fuconolactonase|nr:amidohydrolase family protein [Planctomycetota bacterium]